MLNFLIDKEKVFNKQAQLIINYSFLAAALIGLYFTTWINYLLFHALAEVFSIVVAFSIFIIAWNSKKYIRNPYLLFIGIAYLFIAFLDLLHALSYKGMSIFTGYDYYANELWIAARYMESITLFIALILLSKSKDLKVNTVLVIYTIVTGLLIASIFYWKNFPECFVDGSGLTPFKKISEYIICGLLVGTILLLQKNREKFEKKVFKLLLAAIICTIISEWAFTIYIDNYDFSNLVGHYFKIFSFFLIYEAIIKTGIEKPLELIFLDLDRINQDLNKQTAELAAINIQLENERRLQEAVMHALPIGVAITDKSGGILHTNKAYEMIWGGPRPEALSLEDYSQYKAWWADTNRLVAPDEWASARVVQQGKASLGQMMRIQRFDGTEAFILNSASPVYDVAGDIIGSAVAIQDITELKRAEYALYESEKRLRLFIEHAPVALAMFDCDMRFLSVSRLWSINYHLGDRDLRGLSIYDVHRIPERWRETHRRGLAGEVIGLEEDYYEGPDGSILWIRWEIRPWHIFSGEIGGIVIFTEDITQRKKVEEQLKTVNDDLERKVEQRTFELQITQAHFLHAEKLSAIGKLSASIAHEFNNPLQGVITTLKGLKRRAILDEEDKELLDLAIEENERMKNLIKSLQDFNRPTTGKKELVDIHMSLNSLLLLSKSDFKQKRVATELNYAERLPMVHAIPDQIKQVFLNLLNNAVAACGQRGGLIKISTWHEKEQIGIAINDSGVGIAPENIDQIFQPFYTTKSDSKGTGLGLSVCYGIIQKHGGKILVESHPGIGSTFTVYLPINQDGTAV